MIVYFNIGKDLIYVPIFMIINLILFKINDYINIKIKSEFMNHICDGCLIIFYIFEKYLLKGNNNKNEFCIKINKISYKMIILFICSIILLCIDNYSFIYDTNISEMEDLITTILFLILIEFIFFDKIFYRHQILSIIIIILSHIYLFVKKYIESSLKIYYILYILQFYCYSFSLNLIKYINTQYFISIYLLGSIHGIFLLIQDLIQKSYLNFSQLSLFNILFIIFSFIIYLTNNFLYYKIIEKLGPIYLFMSELISYFIFREKKSNLISIIINLLLIISCSVYLEILELNFCNLNQNTKKNIENRAEEEIINQLSNSLSINSEIEI